MGGNDALFRFLLQEAGNVPSLYLGYSPAVEKYHHLLGKYGFSQGTYCNLKKGLGSLKLGVQLYCSRNRRLNPL